MSLMTATSYAMEMPGIGDFLPRDFLFEGTPFAMNRFEIIRLFAVTLLLVLFGVITSRAAKRAAAGNLVPTKPQAAVEFGLEFVRNMVFDSLGEKDGKRWLPMITTIFFGVLFLNITGVVPGLNLAASAGFGVPLILGLWAFTAYWRQGIRTHGGGLKGGLVFVKNELFKPGLPVFVYPIMAVSEALQLLVIRPISLAVRLFANMMSGHILLGLTFVLTSFLAGSVAYIKPLAAFGIVTSLFMVCFEIFVAALQAYVFALLTCTYISLSTHHDEAH